MSEFDAKARTWDANERRGRVARAVAELIAARVPSLATAEVLEVGAGTGLLGFALAPRVRRLTLGDSSSEMRAVAQEKLQAQGAANVEVVELDLVDGPLPARSFDVICAHLVMHHVPDTGAALGVLRELLAPGGTLCISDLDAEDGSFHGKGFGGHNGFDRQALRELLQRAGLAGVTVETAFEIEKPIESGEVRRFPGFLAIARRP